MGGLPASVQSPIEQNNISTHRLQREARQAINQVVSQQERQQAINVTQSTLSDALRLPGDIGADLNEAAGQLDSGTECGPLRRGPAGGTEGSGAATRRRTRGGRPDNAGGSSLDR